jgi:hypothetical protein
MNKEKNLNSKLFDLLKNNKIIIPIIILFILFSINYLITATRNVPFMDIWISLNNFGENIMTNNLSLRDAWTPYAGHRNPLSYILFFINMRFLGYNTQVEIFGGLFFCFLTSICLIYAFKKENTDKQNRDLLLQLLCIAT